MTHTVLVTGVGRHVGARVAAVLAADPGIRVIGVDTVSPERNERDGRNRRDGGAQLQDSLQDSMEFVQVDLRSPDITRVIAAREIDTVVHMSLLSGPARSRSAMKEHNVIGTLQMLAACQRSNTVRRVVVRSTTAVYGSSPLDPAVFTESGEPAEPPTSGYGKDAVEVEGFVRGFARRCPDVAVTTLRFANLMGPGVDSALTRYFTQPVLPTVFGFDPRLQFIHEDDVVEVLRRTATEDHPGTYNAAGEGVLLLSQCVRRAGRPTLPVPGPAFRLLGELARGLDRLDFSPEQVALMSHGRAVDSSRLTARLGWSLTYSTAAAYADFLRSRGLTDNLPLAVLDAVAGLIR